MFIAYSDSDLAGQGNSPKVTLKPYNSTGRPSNLALIDSICTHRKPEALLSQAVYYGLRVNVLVLREAAQKAVAEKRAQEAKAAQADPRETPPIPLQQTPEVKAEQPQGTTGPSPLPTPTTGKSPFIKTCQPLYTLSKTSNTFDSRGKANVENHGVTQ